MLHHFQILLQTVNQTVITFWIIVIRLIISTLVIMQKRYYHLWSIIFRKDMLDNLPCEYQLQWNQWKYGQNKMSIAVQISKILQKFFQMSVQEWNAHNLDFFALNDLLLTVTSIFLHGDYSGSFSMQTALRLRNCCKKWETPERAEVHLRCALRRHFSQPKVYS